jgi:hypothetical protein
MAKTAAEQIREDMKLDIRIRHTLLVDKIETVRGHPNCQINLALDNVRRLGRIVFLRELSRTNDIEFRTDEGRKRENKARKKVIKEFSHWSTGQTPDLKLRTNVFDREHKRGYNNERDRVSNAKVFSEAKIPEPERKNCSKTNKWTKDIRQACQANVR